MPTPKYSLAIGFSAALLVVNAVPSRPFIDDVQRIGTVAIPHVKRQVVADNSSSDTFEPLHHLSGNAPYFNSPGVGLTADVPDGCTVTHAAYLIRHSDIYANDFEYDDSLAPFIEKLGNFTNKNAWTRTGAPKFLATWTSPYTNPKEQVSEVTDLGKTDAKALGGLIAQRYQSLLNNTKSFNVWTADADRDQDTSKAFIEGLGSVIKTNITLVVVDEGKNQSGNTLTPHTSCSKFSAGTGSDVQETFTKIYAAPIVSRLNGIVPEFNWTVDDVFAAQSLCGYETVIRNSSEFCKMFGEEEWLGYEYASDLHYYRQLGYGSDLSVPLGLPWVTASTRLLNGQASTSAANSSAGTQKVWLSFSHREEPPFVITALGLYNTSNASMPLTSINYERSWRTSEILPFLANVGLERMSCSRPTFDMKSNSTNVTSTVYIRTLVNSASLPIPGCSSGPDGSCPIDSFTSFVQGREQLFGNIVSACGINDSNATTVLGIYEGVFPANGSAIHTESISTQGSEFSNPNSTSVKASGNGAAGGASNLLASAGAAVLAILALAL